MPPPRFAVLSIDIQPIPTGFAIVAITDVACHLWMRWTTTEPQTHPQTRILRGLAVPAGVRFCFVVYKDNEQEEVGDTIVHTFIKPDWIVCETRWFYFHGEIGGVVSPSTTAVLNKHRSEEVPELYVISLGKLGEAEILQGHVKLKEGVGVTITRDDANNALEIAAAAAAYEGFGDKWLKYDPDNQLLGSLVWCFDEVNFTITGSGKEARLYTTPMRAWGFRSPCSCEYKLARGADASGYPYLYTAIVEQTADIRNNRNLPSIGWYMAPDTKLSCFNSGGVGFTQTDFVWGPEPPAWFKWELLATEIKFYINTTLVATHNTNLPTANKDCFFAIQAVGSSPVARRVHITQPHYHGKP